MGYPATLYRGMSSAAASRSGAAAGAGAVTLVIPLLELRRKRWPRVPRWLLSFQGCLRPSSSPSPSPLRFPPRVTHVATTLVLAVRLQMSRAIYINPSPDLLDCPSIRLARLLP